MHGELLLYNVSHDRERQRERERERERETERVDCSCSAYNRSEGTTRQHAQTIKENRIGKNNIELNRIYREVYWHG